MYEYVIVGGGVHGTHLAVRLLSETNVEREDVRILEPDGQLLGAFRRQCRQCGINELRSPYVHHIGIDPFSLRDFARGRDRMDELCSSETGGDRPTADLFFDHADWVIARRDLNSIAVPARATGVSYRNGGLVVETPNEEFPTRRCVLAVGHGGVFVRPAWAESLPADAPVAHVYDEAFDPSELGDESVCVVGGGITAAQVATTLAQPGRKITVLSRSPLRVEQLEADNEWMHPGDFERLRSLPPGSKARHETVCDARRDGTIPPYMLRRLRRFLGRETVELRHTEIEAATWTSGPVVANCNDGTAWCFDCVLLATGFSNPYTDPLYRSVAHSLDLDTGYQEMPVLDDETLAWRTSRRESSPVSVSGVAAESVLGPFARNIVGARRAGERLVAAHEGIDSEARMENVSRQLARPDGGR
jgi:cation diffusion facilitator CzcD-associated flavoprotein CzcO